MPLEKTDKKRESGRLLIFSERACCRRTLPQTSGSCRIFLSGEDTGLSQDITLTLTAGEGCWYMGERELNGKNPFYFYTDRKERLLLVLGQRTDTLYPGERILLKEDGEVRIGSAFRNRIFYECFSLMEENHARILLRGQERAGGRESVAGREIPDERENSIGREIPGGRESVARREIPGERENSIGREISGERESVARQEISDGGKNSAGKKISSGPEMILTGLAGAGVYVNGRAAGKEERLHTGDQVEIYGLRLLVLGKMLVCTCLAGIFRAAGTRGVDCLEKDGPAGEGRAVRQSPGTERSGGENVLPRTASGEKSASGEMSACEGGGTGQPLERICGQEEALAEGEVELLLPEKPSRERSQPLFLSLGPSLTMVLPMLLMAELGNRYMGDGSGGFYYLSVAMSGCSALLSLFWGLTGQAFRKREEKQQGREKERQYREYLEETERDLLASQEKNRRILFGRYPPFTHFSGEGRQRTAVLWNRYHRQNGFLFLRLGLGDIPFQIKIRLSESRRNIVEGKHASWARGLAEKYSLLRQAPVGIDFGEVRQLGIVAERRELSGMVLQLVMQAAACLCYTEVKLACFYRRERYPDHEIAGCIRWLSHVWSRDRRVRFLAGDEREAGEILPALTREVSGQEQTQGQALWYLVFVLDPELIRGEPLYGYLTDPAAKHPVSAVFTGRSREELPKSCRCFFSGKENAGEILSLGEERISRQALLPELCSKDTAGAYARGIAGIRVRESGDNGRLPEKVDFLQLFGCRRVEELESGRRWSEARTWDRLKAVVGMGAAGRAVSLDVHEKFHGPHGLVAGTTGSGKSELLQTFLLSVAVSYSPADVNFFMIDYKGGGTGNLLKRLPHCAGVISNLSGRQIKRAMSAITSENRRRQRLLGKAQVNHIDAYTRLCREGKASQAMPHLLLVVDEFAELKKEEPEFMQEIISLAQVGRSLGMHLILATQKPAGTVDEKIWSNARFRLCLRVQDRQDSMDMLHNGDAALLTGPGQCYLQIGNHEYYELFQAGYCGGPYRREEKKTGAVLVSDTGKRLRTKAREEEQGQISQLEAVTDYVCRTAEEYRFAGAQSLWLPELPEQVFWEELLPAVDGGKRSGPEEMGEGRLREPELLLGLCDDPENQCRPVLSWDPLTQGHLALCAGPATGKTTFVQMLLWQLCVRYAPFEVQILAVDPGQENLGDFAAMPHCLGVLKEKEGVDIFFYHLEKLMEERRGKLAGAGCAAFNRSRKGRLPWLFLAVDNFGSLKKIWEERQEELFLKLAAEGLTLGIYLIVSAQNVGEMGGRLYEKFKTTLAMEMSDRFQYGDVLRQYYLPVLPQENCKGRGLCRLEGRILEFQSAMIGPGQEDFACCGKIKQAGVERTREIRAAQGALADRFPVVPRKVDFETLAREFSWKDGGLALGYCLSTGERKGILPRQTVCFLISGKERTGRTTLLGCLIEGALRQGMEAVVLDHAEKLAAFKGRPGVIYLSSEEEMERWREERRKRPAAQGERKGTGVFLANMGKFCRFLSRSGEVQCSDSRDERLQGQVLSPARFWEQAARGEEELDFLTGIFHPDRDYEAEGTAFFREFTAWQQGIHLGGNVAEQRALSFDDLSYAAQNRREPPGTGYLRQGAGSVSVRLRLPGRFSQAVQPFGEIGGKEHGDKDDSGGYSGSAAG